MNKYDEKQYESYSYSLTFPEHLQTVGTLFGLKPAPYRKARVLELGCASGGNIIPLAVNFPEMEVVGIDYSPKQVEEGQALIKELGLSNIKLLCASIADYQPEGEFDYIICHGVYSWVDESIRKKILELHQNHLSDYGIGCISYNTMPAWNMVLSVREMMKFHVRNFKTAEEKVTQARTLITFIAKGLEKDTSPYAKFLKDELGIISKANDTYIYHEYLEDVNKPLYFYQFVKQCAEFELSYLGDSNVPSMFPGNLKQSFNEKLSEIKDVVRMGQYMDFIRNQRFRTTLICRKKHLPQRSLKVDSVESYCLSYCGQFQDVLSEAKVQSNEAVTFQSPGIVLTIQKPFPKACMKVLHDRYGKPIAYDDLVDESMKLVPLSSRDEAKRIINQDLNLMRLFLGGIVNIHMDTGIYAQHIPNKPQTTELVRITAKARNMVPNLRHETHKLLDIERIMLQFLDGNHTIPEIKSLIEQKISAGELNLTARDGGAVTDPKEITEKVNLLTLSTLESLTKKAFLMN